MRLFGGKIGFVGSGIHSLSSQILSKSFRNWFENRTLRGTKEAVDIFEYQPLSCILKVETLSVWRLLTCIVVATYTLWMSIAWSGMIVWIGRPVKL